MLSIIYFFLITFTVADEEFIVELNQQKFIRFQPDKCYSYDGMSVKVEKENNNPKLTYFNSNDCSGSTVNSDTSSKLISLMKSYTNNIKYKERPNYIFSVSLFDKDRCPNNKTIIKEYYTNKCLDLNFSSRKYSISEMNWIVCTTYSDPDCLKKKEEILLYKCDVCTNNIACSCDSGCNSLIIMMLLILLLMLI